MFKVGPASAAFAAVGLLCACRGGAVVTEGVDAPAFVEAPSLVWQQARRVNILCRLSTAAGNDPVLERDLCDRVRAIAAAGAPLPVAVAEAPDPATLGGGNVVLLVHASMDASGSRPVLIFTIRPYRQSAGDSAALFGTAPRAVPLDGAEAALRTAIAEILPWLAGATDPRPL